MRARLLLAVGTLVALSLAWSNRFLQDDAGVDPSVLSAAARSEYQPRTTNDTEEGRRQNRRIEILLGPEGSVSPAREETEQPAP